MPEQGIMGKHASDNRARQKRGDDTPTGSIARGTDTTQNQNHERKRRTREATELLPATA